MNVILPVDLIRYPLTGIGRYVFELASALPVHGQIERLRLLAGQRFVEAVPRADARSGAGHGLKRLAQQSRLLIELYARLGPWLRSRRLQGLEDHLYHGPNFFLPRFAGPCVATFHDLSAFHWPECHDPRRLGYLQREMSASLVRASALITDSEFTCRELLAFSALPAERIHAVPLACSPAFRPREAQSLRPVLADHGLEPGAYSLYVGTIEPRKNLTRLLAAYARLPAALRQRWPLVLSGYRGWCSEGIHAQIARGEREGWVRYLGFVPGDDLPLLFAGARLFAFPSLYEGFGLPVLEAMASGVPVVCSDSASLPEVAGEAALLCHAEDDQQLTRNLQRALEDEAWREAATARGLARAADFSWQRCAEQTAAVYRRVMMGGGQ